MTKTHHTIRAILAAILIAAFLLPGAAFAAPPVDPTTPGTLAVSYANGGVPIPNAPFRVYHVAGTDSGLNFTKTPAFASYPISLAGNSQAAWQNLALTLKGYVLLDSIAPVDSGTTDAAGTLAFGSALTPGLYLLLGDPVTVGNRIYTPTPTLITLPAWDSGIGTWKYNVTVEPKSTVTVIPPTVTPEYVTRKVLKIWDDAGLEAYRPEEIEANLLRNGAVYDTVKLNKENNWRYTWTNLDDWYDWIVVEKPITGYTVRVDRVSVTYTITNTADPALHDPPVRKIVKGDTPEFAGVFRFTFEPVSNTAGIPVSEMPMPEGPTAGGKRVMDVTGPGDYEFGIVKFMRPGIYVYEIREEDTGYAGYTYDTTVFTCTYTVTEDSSHKLSASLVTTKKGTAEVFDKATYTNEYKKPDTPPTPPDPPIPPTPPEEKLPQTGQLWWPVPILGGLGILLILLGLLKKRRDAYGE